jgi:copper chaperone CopZ
MKKTIQISGMTCMHCSMRVEKALKAVQGVNQVNVDLRLGQATLDVNEQATDLSLKNAIKEAGYKPGKIEGSL